MLTTDGVLRHLEDAQIHDILRDTPTLQAACDQLIDLALDAGGEDNATCVLIRVKQEDGGSSSRPAQLIPSFKPLVHSSVLLCGLL